MIISIVLIYFQAVTEPQLLAMKKINRMQKKKEAKKRKMENYKKTKLFAKKRKPNFKDNDSNVD